jgi:uncharacterized protein with ParB-like and HNH nuclease domain
MDSIFKGYPIGTFIFWKTKDRLRSIRDIGNISLPDPESGDYVNFVLDGQQRLTSLFAALKGAQIERENGYVDDYSGLYIDLHANEDEQIVILDISDKEENTVVKITDLINGGLTFLASFPQELHPKLEEYKRRIENYLFSIIYLKEAPLEVATEVFTRINVGGKSLTLFEIMVAKTFDYEKNFDLSAKFNELVDRVRPLNYETISDATVLHFEEHIESIFLSENYHLSKKTRWSLLKRQVIDLESIVLFGSRYIPG